MNKYIFSYYIYNKRIVLFIIIIISILVTVFTWSNSSLSNTNSTYMQRLEDLYGKHDCIYYDLSAEQINNITKDSRIESVGIFINAGNYLISDSGINISVGSFDESAIGLSNISLVEGVFPKKSNEICLESHFKYLFDKELNIGDSLDLIIDGDRAEFSISGFVSDYSAYWNLPDNIAPGYNDYPGGILEYGKGKELKQSENILVKIKGADQIPSHSSFEDMLMIINDYGPMEFLANDNHGAAYEYMFSKPIRTYMSVFSILYMFLSTVIFYYLQKLFIKRFRSSSEILEKLGQYRRQRFVCYCLLGLFVLIAGTVLGSGISLLFMKGDYLSLVLASGYAILSFVISYMILYAVSFHIFTRKTRAKKDFTLDYRLEFAFEHMRNKVVSMIPIILMIILLLSSVFCIDLDKKYRYDDINNPNYLMYAVSSQGYQLAYFHGFKAMSYVDEYNYDRVRELRDELSEKVYFNYSFESNCALVLPSIQTDYWKTVLNESVMMGEDLPCLSDNLYGTMNYNLVVIKDHLREDFKQQYPEIDIDKDLASGKTVLFMPPKIAFDPDTMSYSRPVYDDILIEGEKLNLGCLTYEGSFNEALENKDLIFQQKGLIISKIYHEQTVYFDGYNEIHSGSNPMFFITEETAKDLDLFPGIRMMEVLIPVDSGHETYEMIKNGFLKVALTSKGASIFEDRIVREFLKGFYHQLDKSLVTSSVLYISALLIAMYAIIDTSISINEREFALLKSMGCSFRDFFTMSISEYGAFAFICYIICTGTSYILLKWFIKSILVTYVPSLDILRYLMIESMIFVGILVMVAILSVLSARKVIREDIAQNISLGE